MDTLKYSNIPIFIPELACLHRCIFCNQVSISGQQKIPQPDEIDEIIQTNLRTIPRDRHINIAFFGGSFTGISIELQEQYLEKAYKYVDSGQVQGIRLSTRPDYIDSEILDMLKIYGVQTIELGAQSTNDSVLQKSGRGHTSMHIEEASMMINDYGFNLGLQMMIGLPGDSHEISLKTAEDIVRLKAKITRIYPTLVVKGTALETLYQNGKYTPASLEEAVKTTKDVYKIFINNNVKVIRTGLHPSEELSHEKSLIAGPYHNSFKELVLTDLWMDILNKETASCTFENLIIQVNKPNLNYAIGYKSKNRNILLQKFKKVIFVENNSLNDFELILNSGNSD